ncbi:hypothetical protein GIB67_020914 [Kingdonia uniflora]|uniref:RanBP2-type domain-containing protein n=1 Tax=Kingdonia uniflora TaxID=39325 RepID=A0A7J7M7F8_9MAGN|nr:hypothetical protein GIB67_020914 [Kingdonia uniflora]
MYHHHPKIFSKSYGCLLHFPKFISSFSNLRSPNQTLASDSGLDQELPPPKPHENRGRESILNHSCTSELSSVKLSRPWPEWTALLDHLSVKGFYDDNELGTKESNHIRTACLSLARHRFDIIPYFSHKDIQVIVESGCPSIDRKVVNSGKRLRARVGLDEKNVCSSCYLRGRCDRAYVKACKDESGRTVDVMRILLTYGLDTVSGLAENKSYVNERVEDSVRRLLSEMVKFTIKEYNSDRPRNIVLSRESSIEKGEMDSPIQEGDWVCPKCKFVNFARNIKCLSCDQFPQERFEEFWEDQDHLPMKKGDWICDKCNFLNFANNTRCWRCKQKPAKRQLNPGEWECDSCNYINFKRNMICLKCNWKRPKAKSSYNEDAQSPDEDTFSWSSEEDGDNNSDMIFPDFPIVGGKSVISQNSQAREKWKSQMMSNGSKQISSKESIQKKERSRDNRVHTYTKKLGCGAPERKGHPQDKDKSVQVLEDAEFLDETDDAGLHWTEAVFTCLVRAWVTASVQTVGRTKGFTFYQKENDAHKIYQGLNGSNDFKHREAYKILAREPRWANLRDDGLNHAGNIPRNVARRTSDNSSPGNLVGSNNLLEDPDSPPAHQIAGQNSELDGSLYEGGSSPLAKNSLEKPCNTKGIGWCCCIW